MTSGPRTFHAFSNSNFNLPHRLFIFCDYGKTDFPKVTELASWRTAFPAANDSNVYVPSSAHGLPGLRSSHQPNRSLLHRGSVTMWPTHSLTNCSFPLYLSTSYFHSFLLRLPFLLMSLLPSSLVSVDWLKCITRVCKGKLNSRVHNHLGHDLT